MHSKRKPFRRRQKITERWLVMRARHLSSTLPVEAIATEFGLGPAETEELLRVAREEEWTKDRRAAWRDSYAAVRRTFEADLASRTAEFLCIEADGVVAALRGMEEKRRTAGKKWTPFQWAAYARAQEILCTTARKAFGLDGTQQGPTPTVHFTWVPRGARAQIEQGPTAEVVIVDAATTAKPSNGSGGMPS